MAAFAILLLGPSPWAALPALALVLLLADVGLAVIGTLVAALAVQTRARDLLVPLLALPLSRAAGDRGGARERATAGRRRRGGARGALAGRPRPL